jgi:hypothetical protein
VPISAVPRKERLVRGHGHLPIGITMRLRAPLMIRDSADGYTKTKKMPRDMCASAHAIMRYVTALVQKKCQNQCSACNVYVHTL